MRFWLIHAPDGDHQVLTEDRETEPHSGSNPDGHPFTEVDRHGQWYERFDRDTGAWVRTASDEDIAQVRFESELLTMSRLDFYRLIERMVCEKIEAAEPAPGTMAAEQAGRRRDG
jgi:hypothetical protein